MATIPQANLSPKSQPWGRYVDKQLHDLTTTSRISRLNIDNNLMQLNSSVDLLGRQQTTLYAQQEEINAQQDYLSSFQTYVSYAQNQLTGTVYNTNELLGTQTLSFFAPRTLSAQVTAYFNFQADARDNAGYYGAWFFNNIVKDENNNAVCLSNNSNLMYGDGGGMNMIRTGLSSQSQGIYTFSPGWHTLTSYFYYTLTANTPANAYVYLYNRSITVTVIG